MKDFASIFSQKGERSAIQPISFILFKCFGMQTPRVSQLLLWCKIPRLSSRPFAGTGPEIINLTQLYQGKLGFICIDLVYW